MKASYFGVLFFLIIFFSSCTDYLNKPLAEPMSVEDLKGAIKQDSAFLDFYETVQKFRKEFFAEDLNQVKYGDLTYRRLYDYVNKMSDSLFTQPLYDKAKKEWDSKYSVYTTKVDSVASYWKKYEEENSLNSYVSIVFKTLDKEYYSYSHDVRSVNLGFQLTPLKGKVEQVKFSYEVTSKLDTKMSSYWNDDKGNCISTSPFSTSVIRYWESPYSLEKKLKYKTTEDFLRDYDVEIKVTAVRVNGENFSEDSMRTPTSVIDYLRFESDYWEGLLIKDCIYPDYKTIDDLYEENYQEALKSYDNQCFEFIGCIKEKYVEL